MQLLWFGVVLIPLADECRHVEIVLLYGTLHRILNRLQAWPLSCRGSNSDARGGSRHRVSIAVADRPGGNWRRILHLISGDCPGRRNGGLRRRYCALLSLRLIRLEPG